jgi:D-sedoheptulose 7-phosphate isomerase
MDYLRQLIERYPKLSSVRNDISRAYSILEETFSAKGKLLIAGNGGSAADAEHITGELMKNFIRKREIPPDFKSRLHEIDPEIASYLGNTIQQGLPAIALNTHTALITASVNDISGDIIYAQQVYGYGCSGDTFLGISTSGNAKNIIYAIVTAKAKNMKTIVLSGATGGVLKNYADVSINVPENETYKIQELHLPIYHVLCLMIEEHFFP